MRPLRALPRPARIVIQEQVQKRLLIADIQNPALVQPVQALDECLRAAQRVNQRRHVAGHEKGVEPHRPLVRLPALGVEVARSEVQQRRAVDGVLNAESPIKKAGLKEAHEAGVSAVDHACLGRIEHVLPVPTSPQVFVRVVEVAQGASEGRDDEVVVCVLDGAADGARFQAHAVEVEVICGDVAEFLPGGEAAAPFDVPVWGLDFGVFDERFVGQCPVDSCGDVFEVGVYEDDVGVGAALGVT